jgi:hypothetical protein
MVSQKLKNVCMFSQCTFPFRIRVSHLHTEHVYGPFTGGPNDVRLEENSCGCVFALDVDPMTYTAVNMYGEFMSTHHNP